MSWLEYMQQHLAAVAGSNHVSRRGILRALDEILLETALVPKGVRRLQLSNGRWALVDAPDFERLVEYTWTYGRSSSGREFAYRRPGTRQQNRVIGLHHEIMPVRRGLEIDHINGNGLDCRRANLRYATRQQNSCNRPAPRSNRSGYKGVYWSAWHRKWIANIRVNYRTLHLGGHATPELAALAYNRAAKKHFGRFARLNEVPR